MNEAALIEFGRWQTRALLSGAVAGILSLLGAFFDRAQFFHSYLFAWLFWSGLSFGALVVLMMQFLTGGLWGLALRNFALAAISTLPLMALLFLPVLLGLRDIYPWTHGLLAETGGYHHKAQWLNIPFFTARSIFYFAILVIIALLLRRWSLAQANPKIVPTRLSALSASGLIAYVLCMNFASTDWVMSLDPQWYSTIFVIVFIAGTFPRRARFPDRAADPLDALVRRRDPGESLQRSREPASRFRHFLDLRLFLAIPHHLVGQFAEGNLVVSGAQPRRLAMVRDHAHGREFLLPFAAPAFARGQAEPATPLRHLRAASCSRTS